MKAVKTNAERTRYTNAQTTADKIGNATNTRAIDKIGRFEATDYENTCRVLASFLGVCTTLGQAAELLRMKIAENAVNLGAVNLNLDLVF